MNLKELRMWHWRQVLDYRRAAREIEKSADQQTHVHRRDSKLEVAAAHNKLANFHIGCVQVLNDYLPGTAEQDCAEIPPTVGGDKK